MTEFTASTSRNIRDALEDDIVTGKLPPGTKLDEASLSERFDVSRTPVRESLRFLCERGLVDLIRNRGAFVAQISMPRLIEMFEVMAELEGMCGRLCARRITSEVKADLMRTHEACRRAGERGEADKYYYLNEEFHDVIYQGCRNGFLTEQVKQLRRRLQPYRRMQLRVPKRMRDSFDEHQVIVDAILGGDEGAAEAFLKSHLLIQGERFTDFVAMIGNESANPHRVAAESQGNR